MLVVAVEVEVSMAVAERRQHMLKSLERNFTHCYGRAILASSASGNDLQDSEQGDGSSASGKKRWTQSKFHYIKNLMKTIVYSEFRY